MLQKLFNIDRKKNLKSLLRNARSIVASQKNKNPSVYEGFLFGCVIANNRQEISLQKNLNKLSADFVHSRSTDRAFSFHRWFAVFHRYPDCFWIIALCSAFNTIHFCHSLFTSLLHKINHYGLSSQCQYKASSPAKAIRDNASVLNKSLRIA